MADRSARPAAPGSDPSSKPELRRAMRSMRRSITDRAERSVLIWEHVRPLLPATGRFRLLAFESVPGEPETASFIEWCSSIGVDVAVPAAGPDPALPGSSLSDPSWPDPSWPDVVIVPGLAFTARGDRLGQGGGWYDRFLAGVRPGCRTIGVGFVEQIVDALPVEVHDIRLDHVVTESGDIVG
jgi:5-formyltetrahydrofolate cyclo-ligase